jgi:hypothetical protein
VCEDLARVKIHLFRTCAASGTAYLGQKVNSGLPLLGSCRVSTSDSRECRDRGRSSSHRVNLVVRLSSRYRVGVSD